MMVRATLHAARAGQPTTALQDGEAGIGKTRLADEAAVIARADGMRVLRGEADASRRDRWSCGGASTARSVPSPLRGTVEREDEESDPRHRHPLRPQHSVRQHASASRSASRTRCCSTHLGYGHVSFQDPSQCIEGAACALPRGSPNSAPGHGLHRPPALVLSALRSLCTVAARQSCSHVSSTTGRPRTCTPSVVGRGPRVTVPACTASLPPGGR